MNFFKNKFKLATTLEVLLEINYLIIIFWVPLCFAIFLKNSNVFELNKLVLFQCLVGVFLFLTLGKLLLVKSDGHRKILSWGFFKKYLFLPVLFFGLLSLSQLVSINPANSWAGLYDRQEGLRSYSFYGLFFLLLLYNLINSPVAITKRLKRIAMAATVAAGVSSLYGLLQIVGIDFVKWTEPPLLTGRATSTLGQPNFLGSYLILVWPLSLYLFAVSRKFLVKFMWLAVSAIELIGLFFTASRGAWVGLFLGVIIIAFSYLWPRRHQFFRKGNYRLLILLFSALGMLVILGFSNSYVRDRLASTLDLKSGSVASRVYFWQGAVQAISERPILGYGLENQEQVLAKYYSKDWGVFGNVNAQTNRAHNLVLDICLTTGLFGLVIFLSLIYLFYRYAWQNIKSKNHEFFNLAVITGFSTYLISLLFGFSFVAGQVYFWMFLALVFAINFLPITKSASLSRYHSRILVLIAKLLALAVVAFLLIRQINQEFKVLIADHYFQSLQQNFIAQDYFTAYVLFGYIKDTGVENDYYGQKFIKSFYDNFPNIKALAVIKKGQTEVADILLNLKGDTLDNLLAQARGAIIGGDYSAAQAALDKLIAYNPRVPENYLYQGDLKRYQKDFSGARASYQLALDNTPDLNDPRLNSQHYRDVGRYRGYLYRQIAETYLAEKETTAAREYFRQSLLSSFDLGLYKKIADTYYQEKNLDKAIWYNERALRFSSNDYTWYYILALLYQEKGDKVKALEYAEQAFSLNSSDINLKNLLDSLK